MNKIILGIIIGIVLTAGFTVSAKLLESDWHEATLLKFRNDGLKDVFIGKYIDEENSVICYSRGINNLSCVKS